MSNIRRRSVTLPRWPYSKLYLTAGLIEDFGRPIPVRVYWKWNETTRVLTMCAAKPEDQGWSVQESQYGGSTNIRRILEMIEFKNHRAIRVECEAETGSLRLLMPEDAT